MECCLVFNLAVRRFHIDLSNSVCNFDFVSSISFCNRNILALGFFKNSPARFCDSIYCCFAFAGDNFVVALVLVLLDDGGRGGGRLFFDDEVNNRQEIDCCCCFFTSNDDDDDDENEIVDLWRPVVVVRSVLLLADDA